MDNDPETINMVLDIPNTVSLNPFDRPPNIMDDELNSVTQEELEANLSTDCPPGATDTTPAQNCNDMWEQLIQSFLEDNSTQDAVVQSVQTEPTIFEEEDDLNKENAQVVTSAISESLNILLEQKPEINNSIKPYEEDQDQNSFEEKREPDEGNLNESKYETAPRQDVSVKDEKFIMDISTEEEQMLSTCVYDVNELDIEDDLCQVEVYATNDGNSLDQHDKENIKSEYYSDEEEDSLSNVSAVSIGYLEPIDEKITSEENLMKAERLSTINNDHCYSQEVSTNLEEFDVLKQNLTNHIKNQVNSNINSQKISTFVEKLLNNLDNNKLDIILNSLSINKSQEDSHSGQENPAIIQDVSEEPLNDITEDMQQGTDSFQNLHEEMLNEDQRSFEDVNENTLHEKTDIDIKQVAVSGKKETPSQHEEILEENVQTDEPLLVENDPIESKQTTDNDSNNETLTKEAESTDIKLNKETLPYNCSEVLEHQMFDEEFELLCKNGDLPLKSNNTKSEGYSQLLKKLKDFVSQMQKDCEDFSTFSLEDKLLDYIKTQYYSFKELFKPHIIFQQTIETQTKLKKLTKRKQKVRNADKKNLLITSDQSSRNASSSSSLASSSDEDEDSSKEKSFHSKANSPPPSELKSLTTIDYNNKGQEYDDGINLSQYVQSEIFIMDSLSPQSVMVSDSEYDSLKEDDDSTGILSKTSPPEYDNQNGDSDDTIIFNIRSKKSKKLNDSSSVTSTADVQKTGKSQNDNMSVHDESDKENLTSDRKEKKLNESMDEDEKNDREIDRLTNISGLTKRSVCNTSSSKIADKTKPKTATAKTLNDRFDFMDVEFGSEDEVKSEAEEEIITEQQFLRNCNDNIRREMLEDSSTDSECLEEEEDNILKASSEEDDEGGTKSPLVEKFLKTFVVDDSDNDIEGNDDDDEIDLDSDKDEKEKYNEKEKQEEEKLDADIDKEEKSEDALFDGEVPTNDEMELLNDNFLFRKRSAKPQNLDKMLSDAEKRKNISKIDAELISLSSDSSNSDVEAVDVEPSQKPRSLKPMLRPDQLAGETIKAQKLENERISRLEKKHTMLDKVLKDHPDVDKNKELILDYIKDTKTFIKVHPGIVKHLKPHQFDGVRFMYDSCYGGVDALKKIPGSGCILAHCMGLGKTLQLISLLHTVISYKELKTTKILVLCPKSTVMNWADEIITWLGPLRQKNIKVYTFSDTSDINEKLSIIKEWSLSNHQRAGCLLIGYEAFRTLVFYHSYKNRGNVNPERLEEIRLLINKFLLSPGADLVICDEGHIIKNSNSAISKAVAKIETPRRIVLTGTPIQNNLKEYYSMVNFIKPLFLGTEKEFANLYANPIKNGQHKDSGKTDIKIMKQRSFVLHKKLSKFVQRKEAELLKTFLPTKLEYVLFIPMTEVQNNLYQHILNAIKNRDEHYRGKGLITDYTCLRKIWTHPKVLEDAWKNAISQRNKKDIRNKLAGHNSEDDQPDDIYDSQTGQMSVTNDWWRHLVKESDLESVMPSNKLRVMFKILQMCEEKGEKCLIFSAFVAVLNVVEHFFKKITNNDPETLNELKINQNSRWILGQDYYRLDGKTPKSLRHAMINEFNNVNNKSAKVFLISAKAGGQGINLIGANRVIILDTSWNPSNDQQNIFRVFRLGQKRSCYIYRLLAMGTMEEKVYSRSVTKQAMSFRVVDVQQIDRHYNMAELAELYTLTIPDHNNRPTPILPQDSILARLLRTYPELVYKYHEHDSLLENKVEQELSEQEKNEAWTAYERDLQMNSEIKEMPNIEDFQNKFNVSNLSNYLSPFSGLDVSNIQNPSSSKNMSHLFNYNRGFNPNFLQSLLGQNTNAAHNTQQYIDLYNYYKNIGSTYADMSPYASLPGLSTGGGPGRMPTTSTASSVATNPLAALGDLSMFGLQTLGANAAAMNLPNSLGNSSTALQQMSTSASMYTSPSALNTNLPITSASNMAAGGLANASNSAAVLSAFEQYKQSLRGSYNSMYNYTGDFGLSSSGSTILDSSKTKNTKQSGSSNKNINLPGGSKGGSAMGLFSGPPPYMPQPQSQPQGQQQQPHSQQQRPNSRNTPNYEQHQQQQPQQQQQQQHKAKSSTSSSKSSSPSSSSNQLTSLDTNSPGRASSLLSYRRSDSSSLPAANTTKPTNDNLNKTKSNPTQMQKKSDVDGGNNLNNANTKSMLTPNAKGMKAPTSGSHLLSSNLKSSQKSITSQSNNGNSSNLSSSTNSSKPSATSASSPSVSSASASLSLSTTSQADPNRALNMGILYPNSKSTDKTSNQPNSPLNMGIVYPKSSKSSSEMQIIPTSSPPGTISISKQLNELSPSISLTALKSNAPNKTQQNQNFKSNNSNNNNSFNTTQNTQINKIMQNNNLRRTTSPVNSTAVTTIANKSSSSSNTTNQSNLLARIKLANNKKATNSNNNNSVPPLHRASTMVNIPPPNSSAKTSTGLTITNVKNTTKNQNLMTKPGSTSQQISTLAKQTAAAAVAKSNINRLNNNPDNSALPKNGTSNNTNLPSLTAIKRIVKRSSPTVNVSANKPPTLTPSPSLTVTSSNKLPIISSVKSISQYNSSMATISKASITKINSPINQPSNNSMMLSKSSTSIKPQMQKRLPTTTPTASTSANSSNAVRNTVNIRPVDTKQNPTGTGGVYIIETNINDKKLAIGAPTKSGGGTTVTKVPTQTAMKRKSTDPLSKDKSIETKRLKK